MNDPQEFPVTTTSKDVARRSFLSRLTLGLSAVIGLLATLPGLGFVLAPLLRRSQTTWRQVGPIDQFKVGATVLVEFEDATSVPWAGTTNRTGAWLRRESESEFIAFSLNCRHLGCPVRWVDGAGLFMCPCHGGVYYKDGNVAGGPPPEPLDRYPVRVRGGQVEIEDSSIPLTTFDKSLG